MAGLRAVAHVEGDGVVARLGRRPGGLGRVLGGAAHDAPLLPVVLLPDELVLEAGGVAGHLGLEGDPLAGAGRGGRLEAVDGVAFNGTSSAFCYTAFRINNVAANLICPAPINSPFSRRFPRGSGNHSACSGISARSLLLPVERILQTTGLASHLSRNANGVSFEQPFAF